MAEKCFCHFNGYQVKDANAREKIEQETKKLSEEIAVERSRVTNLATLETGSTTGDAELIDIRTAADGTIYGSAGEAVRIQFVKAGDQLAFAKDNAKNIIETGYSYLDGDFQRGDIYNGKFSGSTERVRSNKLLCYGYDIVLNVADGWRYAVVYYNADGTYSNRGNWQTGYSSVYSGQNFRIVISLQSGGEITDVTNAAKQVYFKSVIQKNIDLGILAKYDADLKKTGKELLQGEFGVYDIHNGAISGNEARISTAEIQLYDEDISLTEADEFFRFAVVYYNADGTFSNRGGWTTTNVKIPAGVKFRVVISTVDGTVTDDYVRAIKSVLVTREKFGEYIPNYYHENKYLADKIAAINEGCENLNGGFAFAFITDVHISGNSCYSSALMNKVFSETGVNIAAFGGDIAAAYGTKEKLKEEEKRWVKYLNSFKIPLLLGHGNHDWTIKATSDPDDTAGYTEPKPVIEYYSFKTMRVPGVKTVDGKRYFHYDDDFNNVRYIIVDEYEGLADSNQFWGVIEWMSEEQLGWFVDVLKNSGSRNIVVFKHTSIDANSEDLPVQNPTVQRILEAYVSRTVINETAYGGNKVYADFTDAQGSLVANIGGHNHADRSVFTNGVLTISTANDAHYSDDGIQRYPGTTDEQAFDVFMVDPANRTIKTVRIGAGSDREWTY